MKTTFNSDSKGKECKNYSKWLAGYVKQGKPKDLGDFGKVKREKADFA